ncbi:hypothetical protein BO70DRAFT_357218 [Aspergillus heteromorphus CBS 117.55]|uniref:CFEM domain-containing protein n=1 Tax=Aspergillus heteromorphus CBS 117.55 TaxID=1448321 RepID=A0A317X094_9EURO|nr:uncharacterized protein BO70DRAFT_357218 [Aspergillus heteromorphus CBS 117.55]PWY92066.1 hypothetical protein BO70DRAFT_357218 [Aspergillus heteromorphus CBS 117.55]
MRAIFLVSLLFPLLAFAHPKGLWWGTDECYTSPVKADNECSSNQKTGFNWSDLGLGSFSAYAGFEFSGFAVKNGLGGSDSDDDKCIVGQLSKNSGPQMAYAKDQKGFSVTRFSLATSKTANVRIVYNMPDGSTCNTVAACSQDRTYVDNDQCGGATSVNFQLADDTADNCDLGIYEIDFDCSPGVDTSSSSTLVSPSSTHVGGSSKQLTLTPIPIPLGTPSGSSPVGVTSSRSSPVPTIPAVSSGPVGHISSTASDLESTTTVVTWVTVTTCPVTEVVTSSGKPITSVTSTLSTMTVTSVSTYPVPTSAAPVGSSSVSGPASAPESTTTVVTWETLTTCPVTQVVTSSGTPITSVTSTVSTVTLTSVSTYCPRCTRVPTSAVPTSAVPTSAVPTSAVPTSAVPTSAVPTSAAPTSVAPIASSSVSSPASAPVSAPESITTVVTWETLTTCPVTQVVTSSGTPITSVTSTVSTVTLTSLTTICHRCTEAPSTVGPIATAPAPAPVTTVVTWETVTTCPVTTVVTSSGKPITSVTNTVSTITMSATSTIANTGVTGSAPTQVGATVAPTSTPSTPCPNSVPKCINTWLNLLPKCDSNSAASCYCPSSEFTNKVISCIQAWGASPEEIQSALSYFTGICAAFVPKNPGIVTAIPSTITLGPVPTSLSPVTNTVTVLVPTTVAAPCTTVTYSTWTMTVPQVIFTTATSSAQTTVGLIPAGPTNSTSAGAGSVSTRVPNPWASTTLATTSTSNNTTISTPTLTPTHTPSATPTTHFNSGSTMSISSSLVWSIAVAALLGAY